MTPNLMIRDGSPRLNGHRNARPAAARGQVLLVRAAAAVLAAVSVWLFFPSEQDRGDGARFNTDRTRRQMANVSQALEDYRDEYGHYPDWAVGSDGVNRHMPPHSPPFRVPTFVSTAVASEVDGFQSLTTPLAFVEGYPVDTFAQGEGATFAYYHLRDAYVLYSPGPDGDYDFNPFAALASADPGPHMLAATYDPTNGSGDIIHYGSRRPTR